MIYLHECGSSYWFHWASGALANRHAGGLIIGSFTSLASAVPSSTRVLGSAWVALARQHGAHALWDPMTHIALSPTTDTWSPYGDWNLWRRGVIRLDTATARSDHLARTVDAQRGLGVEVLAPTVTIDDDPATQVQLARALARQTLRREPNAWLAIAGSPKFWADHKRVERHARWLAGTGGTGFVLTDVRATTMTLPPYVSAEEIEGMCRAASILSRVGRVIVANSDLFGLPAVAAGADAIGTGWVLRQRMLSTRSFIEPSRPSRGGSNPLRATYAGLLATLREQEALDLLSQDRQLSRRLYRGQLNPDRYSAFIHHLDVINDAIGEMAAAATDEERTAVLRRRYRSARRDMRAVGQQVALRYDERRWLRAVRTAVVTYARDRGWRSP